MSELSIVSGIFGLILVVGIVYLNRLTSEATDLRAENASLRTRIDVLLDILDTFWKREREITQNEVREKELDKALRMLHSIKDDNSRISIQDSNVHVGRDMTGGDSTTKTTPKDL